MAQVARGLPFPPAAGTSAADNFPREVGELFQASMETQQKLHGNHIFERDGKPLSCWEIYAAKCALAALPPKFGIRYYGLVPDHLFHAVSKHIMNKAIVDKRLQWPKTLFPVEARESPIHGKGVFATKDVGPGQMLTLYPPDALAFSFLERGAGEALIVSPGLDVDKQEATEARGTHAFTLETSGGLRASIVGFPRLCDDPAYLAHMANDPVGRAPSELEYNKKARAKGNAILVPFHCCLCVALVALRQIPAGEEVLAPYNHKYWENR